MNRTIQTTARPTVPAADQICIPCRRVAGSLVAGLILAMFIGCHSLPNPEVSRDLREAYFAIRPGLPDSIRAAIQAGRPEVGMTWDELHIAMNALLCPNPIRYQVVDGSKIRTVEDWGSFFEHPSWRSFPPSPLLGRVVSADLLFEHFRNRFDDPIYGYSVQIRDGKVSKWDKFVTGYGALADTLKGRGAGPSQEYAASFDEVWSAIPSVLAAVGLELFSENKTERYVLAQRRTTAFSWRENVAIFIDPVGASQAKVEVVSKSDMGGLYFPRDWSGAIFKELAKKFKKT